MAITLKLWTLFALLVCSFGCASFARYPNACKSSAESAVWYGFGYIIVGNVFQVGDCSLSKKFRIETGDYYRAHKLDIDMEVKKGLGASEGFFLNDFAQVTSREFYLTFVISPYQIAGSVLVS